MKKFDARYQLRMQYFSNKHPSIIIIIALVCFLGSCSTLKDSRILRGYTSFEEHYEKESWQDYTDYAEYYYGDNASKIFENNHKYKRVTTLDVPELKSFFEDYSQAIVFREGYEVWFDFDYKKQVKENDYFILEMRYPSFGKYDDYDIYYFDAERSILYFFHTNI